MEKLVAGGEVSFKFYRLRAVQSIFALLVSSPSQVSYPSNLRVGNLIFYLLYSSPENSCYAYATILRLSKAYPISHNICHFVLLHLFRPSFPFFFCQMYIQVHPTKAKTNCIAIRLSSNFPPYSSIKHQE